MRRIYLVLLALIVLSVSVTAAQDDDDAVGMPSVLQIVDSDPLPGEELGLEDDIIVYFDREITCDSLLGTVSIAPSVAGEFACADDGLALVFAPAEPFQPATLYTVMFAPSFSGSDGSALGEAIGLEWNTVGLLRVSETLPSDGVEDIAPDAVLTVIFNRPVVPLGIVEDMEALPSPINISPAVDGAGEWLNTSIYTFTPEAWTPGMKYEVSIDADLTGIDGNPVEPFSWSFTTELPRVTEVVPEDATANVRLNPRIQARFNARIDQASLETHFFMRPPGGSGTVAGQFEWANDGRGFSFTPDDLLEMDEIYEIGFPADSVLDFTGEVALPETRWTIATVLAPGIIATDPSDGQDDASPFQSLTIYFASPMDRDTLNDKFTIEPEPWREPDFVYQTFNDSLRVIFPTEPSTQYSIQIAPGMADIYGNTIDEAFTFSYETRPYDPDIALETPGNVGYYNAYRDETQLFLTHRNVSRIDMELYSVSLGEFARRATGEFYYTLMRDFSPSDDDRLRSWSIDSQAPENARRYELLSLGSGDSSVMCPGAMESRLRVGDTAIVISDPDPVRARAAPVDGDIVTLLYRDYVLPVVGGPECGNGMLWWEVRLRDETTAWVVEGFEGEYVLDLRTAAQTTEVVIPADFADGEALRPGLYYLRVSAPETRQQGYRDNEHMLIVGTANLTLKQASRSVFVWATDIQTGEPLVDAPVTIYGDNGRELAAGTTDEAGIAEFSLPRINEITTPRLAVLQTDEYFAVTQSGWAQGIDPWAFGVPTSWWLTNYHIYMHTDRSVYRPDQPVYFRGIVRLKDDVDYTIPPRETVPVRIIDENNETIYERDLPLTEFGTFSDMFDLADDAPLGFYRVVVDLSDEAEGTREAGSISFNVAEYRLPEFQVQAEPVEREVVQGATVAVEVDSTYFFGGAVSDATVEYNVIANAYTFRYTGPGGPYDFGDFNADGGPGEYYGSSSGLISSGTGTTDAQGRFIIEVPADIGDANRSQTFLVEATVRDESDQTVSGRAEVVVHQGEIYLGARPEQYVGTAGSDTALNFIAVDWASEPVSGQEIDIEIIERRWSSVQEEGPDGRTIWTWEVEEIPVTTADVITGDDGRASYIFIPPNGGIFKTTIRGRDSLGNVVQSSTTMWVSSREYVSWRQQNSNRIDLIMDRTEYDIGDTAEVLITSPFQGEAEALITVERDGVLMADRVTLDSNSYVYQFEITEDFAPNAYLSVIIVKGVDENNPVAGFRMGLVGFRVDNSRSQIVMDITPDAEQAGPGDTVGYTLRATDYEGNPVRAEVGVSLTDLAALSIGEPNSGPLLDFFYGQQSLIMQTALALTINTDQLTQTVLDTIKGGGGGFGDAGIFDIREEFVDTPYWDAELVTDDDGIATFEVTLPDNLTTWRLDARAVTNGTDGPLLVGQDTFDLISTKPLLIRPVTPRFFVVDDEVMLAAVVNNNTGEAQAVEVALEGSGVAFVGDAVQSFVIPAGGRQRVTWPVTVEDVSHADLTFFVLSEDGEFTDASRPPLGQGDERLLPVYRYEAPEIVGTGGLLRSAETRTEAIVLPRRFDVTQGELTINVDSSLAASALDGLDYLRNFPNAGIEATVSRFLPNIMTFRALESLGVADAELETDLNREVSLALQRLSAQQKVDGGWGWFAQDESNPLVTAYALIGLHEARESGFPLDSGMIDRAQGYLRTQFVAPGLNVEAWRLDRQAFILYALALSGDADVGRTVALYDSRDRLSTYALGLLALTFDAAGDESGRADTLIFDLANRAITSANGIHWEETSRDFWNWNTNTRTTSIVLGALVKLNPESELIPNVVRWLMVARTADAWETTQETAWAVMALTEWMLQSDELQAQYDWELFFNDDALAGGEVSPETVTQSETLVVDVMEMLRDEANRVRFSRSEGPGNLYYTAYLRAFLPVPEIEPLNRGIIVDRRYTRIDEPDQPITEARIGEVIQVRLTIVAPNNLHYVVIEDPLPAGAEAINPGLVTEQQIGTRPGLDTTDPLSRGWGWWWFSNIEFRDEKVVLNSTYLPAGTYEYVYTIRPGLEGVFNVMPVTGREFYFPEVFGRGDGSTFTIVPAE